MMGRRPYALDHGSRWPDPGLVRRPDQASGILLIVPRQAVEWSGGRAVADAVAQARARVEAAWPIGLDLETEHRVELDWQSGDTEVSAASRPVERAQRRAI